MIVEMVKQETKLDYKLRIIEDDEVLAEATMPESLYIAFHEYPWGELLETVADRLDSEYLSNLCRIELACLELNLAWLKTQLSTSHTKQLETAWNKRLHELRQAEVSSLISHGEVKVGET